MRTIDVEFSTEEKLWRRIEVGHVGKDGMLKANAMRLQVSIVREKHGTIDQVTSGKFNGVATTTAGQAVRQTEAALTAVCIDDPLEEQEGHALIAVALVPGIETTPEQINALRLKLAMTFEVTKMPTKL